MASPGPRSATSFLLLGLGAGVGNAESGSRPHKGLSAPSLGEEGLGSLSAACPGPCCWGDSDRLLHATPQPGDPGTKPLPQPSPQ